MEIKPGDFISLPEHKNLRFKITLGNKTLKTNIPSSLALAYFKKFSQESYETPKLLLEKYDTPKTKKYFVSSVYGENLGAFYDTPRDAFNIMRLHDKTKLWGDLQVREVYV